MDKSVSLVNEVVDELNDRSSQAEYLRKTIPCLKLKPIERNRVRDKLDRIQLRLADVRRLAAARYTYLLKLQEKIKHNQQQVEFTIYYCAFL